MFERRRSYHQIETFVPDLLRQTAPTTGYRDIHRKYSALVGAQDCVEPSLQFFCERGITPPLVFDPTLDFADSDDTDEEVLGSNLFNPVKQMWVALSW